MKNDPFILIHQIETMSLSLISFICVSEMFVLSNEVRNCCSGPFSRRKERFLICQLWRREDMELNSNTLLFDAYGILMVSRMSHLHFVMRINDGYASWCQTTVKFWFTNNVLYNCNYITLKPTQNNITTIIITNVITHVLTKSSIPQLIVYYKILYLQQTFTVSLMNL